GTVGGFDALRAQLATLGPEGEKLWIALTQGVGRNNPKQAQDAIDAVKKAVANTPEALAGAAGYQTMAELQAVAKKAKSTYDYLVESGKYSAEQIATAFKVYQEAANAAMGDSAKAAIAASGAMTAAIQKDLDALGSARDSLVQSIANEAPEEVMGVIEAETRARIAQVEAEIQAKQAQLDAATAAAKAAADAALVATKMAFDETRTEAANTDRDIRERFGKPIRIPIEFVYPGGVVPPGGVGVPPVGNSTGRPPRGSDGAGEQTTITIPLYIDGEMVAESVVRTAKRFGAA
ncbi:MAG TPA: hypothetical protein VNJ04_10375, partial [Gemmatimonadaceae bacterium]|nr:hypothetical protein [Gemmatimonadaceae bacterium]